MSTQPKNKVVHLITLLELGGAQGNTIYTVENLNPDLYDVVLWSGKGAYWDKSVTDKLGQTQQFRFVPFLTRPINPVFDFLALISLFVLLKKHKPSILHTHSSKAGILGRLAGWLAGVPTIIHTYHGFGFNDRQNWLVRNHFVFLEKVISNISDKLIFVSRANINLARELGIGSEDKYVLIRSGIPIKKIRTAADKADPRRLKADLNLKGGKIVTTIGAFKPQKNLVDFVKAAALIRSQQPNTEFLIVGDGAQRPLIESKISDLKLGDQIHLLGWRHDIPEILSISDVFVLTSLWEGLPRALVEALALNVPSVCYETDGVSDLLSKGGGDMVPQGQVKSLADSIVKNLSKNKGEFEVPEEVQKSLNSEFDIDEMVHSQESLYTQILTS